MPSWLSWKNSSINYDEYDILTEYLPWSAETHDKYDFANYIYDRNRKDTCDEICQDTPVKIEENNPCTDIIDTYNRDRAQTNH